MALFELWDKVARNWQCQCHQPCWLVVALCITQPVTDHIRRHGGNDDDDDDDDDDGNVQGRTWL